MRQSLSVHRDVAFDARGRTDLAGQHHTGIDISCHTVALYPYGGKFALNFDLLLPLPEQTSYLAKVQNKISLKPNRLRQSNASKMAVRSLKTTSNFRKTTNCILLNCLVRRWR